VSERARQSGVRGDIAEFALDFFLEMFSLIQFLSGEMEERGGQEEEHEHAEERLDMGRHRQFVIWSERSPKPGAEGEEVGAPGQI
jgi:hypothetical protein